MYVSWDLQNGGHPDGPPLKMHTKNHMQGRIFSLERKLLFTDVLFFIFKEKF